MRTLLLLLLLGLVPQAGSAESSGLRGDAQSIARAEELVERVGGKEIWAALASLHLTQRFYIASRREPVVHDEWIDFQTPRLMVTIQSEVTSRRRAYDDRGGWHLRDGVLTKFTDEELANERGFWKRDMFRILHLIAAEDPGIELRMNTANRLEIIDQASGELLCWFQLNVRSEPILWGATVGNESLQFLFGPLAEFGGLRLPAWGSFTDGSWRFNMLDARGSRLPPQVSYDPPEQDRGLGGQ